MRKILLIEDDKGISASLKLYLESSDYEVEVYEEGSKAVEKIIKYNPDIIILDLNLPGKDGIEITKEYRLKGEIPIVMLTARSSEIDRIRGLEIGADDYIAKPFSPRELLARINVIIKRTSKENKFDDTNTIKCLDIEIDLNKKLVKYKGNNITLTGNEYEILRTLAEAKGGVISREKIMKEIIGYDNYIYDRTIDTHIKNLRKKLNEKDLILTVRGEGYRINL